jgi:hypothetical protein
MPCPTIATATVRPSSDILRRDAASVLATSRRKIRSGYADPRILLKAEICKVERN